MKRPPRPEFRHINRRKLIATELKPVARAAEKSRAKIVSNWDNKPAFQATITVKPELIEIITVVRRGQRLKNSDATTADLWKWIDKTGTRPHPIPKQPKRQGSLAFLWGGPGSYQSKTGANPARYGGPGRVSGGQMVFRKQVMHPGFKPRKFSEAVDKDLQRDFEQAIDRAQRKAQKLGY